MDVVLLQLLSAARYLTISPDIVRLEHVIRTERPTSASSCPRRSSGLDLMLAGVTARRKPSSTIGALPAPTLRR